MLPTWLRQELLSWVNISNCLQIAAPSVSRSSSFPLPSGFQVKACRVMLSTGLRIVWPINLQRLCRISCSTSSRHVRCHNSSLLMISGQHLSRILLRQLLTKVCILFVRFTMVPHVSAPYRRTAVTNLYWKSWFYFQRKDVGFPNILELKNGRPCLANPGFNVCFRHVCQPRLVWL